ncbi:hypothetical protein C4J99_3729 [Pseudomonas synxantha]|nr:hypothetical protein C4J99_3729 [Pseudomonas synxantha]
MPLALRVPFLQSLHHCLGNFRFSSTRGARHKDGERSALWNKNLGVDNLLGQRPAMRDGKLKSNLF